MTQLELTEDAAATTGDVTDAVADSAPEDNTTGNVNNKFILRFPSFPLAPFLYLILHP